MMYDASEIDNILVLLASGQWLDAIDIFKKLNISAKEFNKILENLSPIDIQDMAMLGFYSREFIPTK